jgi:4-hydroxybenzoate polyprenyltransferase
MKDNPQMQSSKLPQGTIQVQRSFRILLGSYIAIARPDHWFKNGFMLLGVMLSVFIKPDVLAEPWLGKVLLGLLAACFIASSNYVLNEILDAEKDKLHPVKCKRPIPSGKISYPIAYLEWLSIALLGFLVASFINKLFFWTALLFWISGLIYNVPPVRSKDIPYLDVLSESLNNPIRLFLGWFALVPHHIPPVSLIISFWMAGAFFMAAKRLAEYRMINDPIRAGNYRASFRHYNANNLFISLMFYVSMCTLFLGIFIVRYHVEIILGVPIFLGFFSFYTKLTLQKNSVVQNPEKLYKNKKIMIYILISIFTFVALTFISIPSLYSIFNIVPYKIQPLWTF